MAKRVLGLLLFAFTSVLAAEQPAKIAAKIVNGDYEFGYPSVGWLDTNGAFCTATLIGCRTLLTAAHCVCTGPNGVTLPPAECAAAGLLAPATKAVFFHHAGVFGVSSIDVHPGHVPLGGDQLPLHDLAVIHLSSPITGIAPAVINQSAGVASDTPGTIVGFGRTDAASQGVGIKRSGGITISACDIPGHLCWLFSGSQSSTCNGDSGGPLFIDSAQGTVLAGVTSFGHSSCAPTNLSYDADVFLDHDWVAAQAGADLATGPVQCGTVSNVGAEGTATRGAADSITTSITYPPFFVPAGTAQFRLAASGNFQLRMAVTGPAGTVICRGAGLVVGFCELNNPVSGDYVVTVENLRTETNLVETVWTALPGTVENPPPDPPAGSWLATPQLPGYQFKVRINGTAPGSLVPDCVPETLCVAGALPQRTELFLRIIGPRPNGFFWAQVVRFTNSRLEVWAQRSTGGAIRYYDLPAVPADSDALPGLVDKTAFAP
ncbi:MAG TPA: trypsin-like serine protease [Thermoanaerobaculia bacterium]|nr:trypsin-like serine protease [Thermoanaerobaculia bacterium]